MSYDVLLRSSGVVSGESDLWCTYAAVRTLTWLDRLGELESAETVADFVTSRQNPDGGYAWSAGMNSDAWATYYCTQTLKDLGLRGTPSSGRPSTEWVSSTHHEGGGYAMIPSQTSDIWATYYAVRTLVEIYGQRPSGTLLDWLGRLQAEEGGLCWSPAHAKSHRPDVRACYYAITAWATATGGQGPLPWDRERLTVWLKSRQSRSGGFTFQDGDRTDCLWATFRAVRALGELGEEPADRDGCVAWVRARLRHGRSFTRWPGYPVQDVWAAFCAVGALTTLGDDVEDIADRIADVVLSFRAERGGFTYREPAFASDALTTSARLLSGSLSPAETRQLTRWLEACMLPNEDGIMYMPGRGSEVRCTLWALAAGAFAQERAALSHIADWLGGSLQNPDGGFGYWEGRASDIVSTCAAAELLHLTGGDTNRARMAGITAFASSCEVAPGAYANVPGVRPTLRATLQALRALRRGGRIDTAAVSTALERHRVRGGGFANEGFRLPDLLSTYEAVLAADTFGLKTEAAHLAKFLDSVRADVGGFAWTPLMKVSGGPLADSLGRQLEMRLSAEHSPLPPVVIS